ncbi:fasciclin-like arabinogalactan protein 4 [Trifolium pratense]|uniref:fasciclin-like arabinogalactan protein 4 n=1 Tax=Trifolium pratense TaxID=57577 RepID=UPI001E691923|nr:fasciclin-like arabinogalactan protein 4 [Trifolium pratense]XP_045791300.1 fasciclin-like arabinogalactan protein 4 [Trifolium pratense]XP_045791301.1 fasciclin-like arabinogalactan protein 4 [Trifolium pratense]
MASSPTFTLPIFIFISMLFCPAPSVASGLNVSEVMTKQTAAGAGDSLHITAGIFSDLKLDLELEARSAFTLFIPVDAAFTDRVNSQLHSISVSFLYILMKAHVVRQYLPPDFLRGLNTFSPPTLACEAMGLSLYHLNVSVGQTSAVMIRMGVVEAVVKNTVYFKSPIAIYAISKVLLPIEMFGSVDVSPHPPHHSPPHSPPPPPCS